MCCMFIKNDYAKSRIWLKMSYIGLPKGILKIANFEVLPKTFRWHHLNRYRSDENIDGIVFYVKEL